MKGKGKHIIKLTIGFVAAAILYYIFIAPK